MIEVTGSYVKTLVATEVPMFNVVSYKVVQTPSNIPIPTPVPTQALQYLQGTLLVNETYPLTLELKR